jgi:type VI secretion system secreted protein Hcp
MAIDMFLKVEGASGESADANHKDWIDIQSFSWGATQASSMASGGGGGSGKVSFNDLHIVATLDKATPALLKHCSSGKHLGEIKVSVCKAGGSQVEYSTVVLKDVIVTSVQFGASNGSEHVQVDYAFQAGKVEQHYWVQTTQGGKGAESQMGWNVKENVATA